LLNIDDITSLVMAAADIRPNVVKFVNLQTSQSWARSRNQESWSLSCLGQIYKHPGLVLGIKGLGLVTGFGQLGLVHTAHPCCLLLT